MNSKETSPLTLAEKILFSHLSEPENIPSRGSYANFRPDRVAMQDATAQMAILQFMTAGKSSVAVPASIHCDHLICAVDGAGKDLPAAIEANGEVYDFLGSAAAAYGIDFWEPGAGIIHQTVLENYGVPGQMMVGTDSHTPNAGGLGMIAIGVGGADAVDVMVGMDWELRVPNIIGVRLTGELGGWAAPKDVILKLAGILTVKGGTNAVIEYFGPGCETLSCTGKATICNMGAEVGATCSVFPFDSRMAEYLRATGRADVAEASEKRISQLQADPEVLAEPEKYYDRVIEIDLSSLEPHVNGPFTPDAATPLSEMPSKCDANNWPSKVEVCLIGSCTNSSYEDLYKAACVARQALELGIEPKAQLIVNPGSSRIRETAERDGLLQTLREAGAIVMTNACGPCIGQWKRKTDDPLRRNSIVTSFNRNFAKRADGNPNTHAFIVSPEIAVAFAFSGTFAIPEGLTPPFAQAIPASGFAAAPKVGQKSFLAAAGDAAVEGASKAAPKSDADDAFRERPAAVVQIRPGSERIQRLTAFPAWDGKDFNALPLLIKVKGKCTTDHISMAGPWLRYRGHLDNISGNLLLGATDAFTLESGRLTPEGRSEVSARARQLGMSVIVAEENYGEGSSREHAAMEPRHLGVKAILAKSFARIHETNLKKQGVLALTFANASDYDKILKGDSLDILCSTIEPGKNVDIVLHHSDGTSERIEARHSYNAGQLEWLRAGSALNALHSACTSAMKRRITVPFIEGDGVGPEVTASMRRILDAALERTGEAGIDWLQVPAGQKAFDECGSYMPDETLEAFRKYGVGIKGPLTTPVGGGIRSLNVYLRQQLDLYVCLRPVRWFKGVASPVKHPENVDMVVFRENTEDIYAGIEWEAGSEGAEKFGRFLREEMGVSKVRFPETSAYGVKPVSIEGTERLVRAACRYALDHGRRKVTLVHKGNIMKFTEGGFRKWGYELAQKEFGDALDSGNLQIDDCICDAFLQNALLRPEDYSVIATLNLNGDYVSDMLAAQVGGIGISPGANINYQSGCAIFEATHGTAPDLAGKNVVNPCSNLLSGVMMLEHLGLQKAADLIYSALERAFEAGCATYDLARLMDGGKALGTKEFTDYIISIL